MTRYAIYFAPRQGGFAGAAAAWLGYDVLTGRGVAQPRIAGLPRPLADLTADPRKYGFHGTIKAPFRLADGVTVADLMRAAADVAARCTPVEMPGLRLVSLAGFLAFVPDGDPAGLAALAAEVVRSLDPCRAALTVAEMARRRPERLTPRQRDLLTIYGYPYVMEEFRFHLTLSGPMAEAEHGSVALAAEAHFAGLVPQPFVLSDICLMEEDASGHFHLMHRYALKD